MGKHSSLGPVDPQFRGTPAHGIKEEFERAYNEIRRPDGTIDQAKVAVWQPIIAKYPPTFVGECEKAISWSDEIVTENLKSGMFKGDKKAAGKETTQYTKSSMKLGQEMHKAYKADIAAAKEKIRTDELNIKRDT